MKSYLKFLSRNKLYTANEAVGLAVSLALTGKQAKEMATRRLLGADKTGIACAIGIPLAVWASRVYLERFAYRVEGYGWVFVAAALISLPSPLEPSSGRR